MSRRDKLRKTLHKAGVGSLLVTNFTNVSYLTGFTGDDSYLLVRPDGDTLLSDARYTTQLEEECPGLDLAIRQPGVTMLDLLEKVLASARLGRLGIESDSMTVGQRNQLAERFPKLELVGTAGLVEQLREIKDAEEIARIREAVWQAEQAFGVVRATLPSLQSERDVVAEMEYRLRRFGASGSSFPPIVAAGPRAALPHARATDQPLAGHDFVLIDWGATGRQYKSDLTRVLVTGKISPKLERVYRVVLNAQERAIDAIRPGVECSAVDQVARQAIAEAGFGKYFGHGLGHGVGLDIHEAPRLAGNSRALLKPGMVVTVEPGIYLPGWGGVRIEDDVLVTRSGHEVLTRVAKQLEESIIG